MLNYRQSNPYRLFDEQDGTAPAYAVLGTVRGQEENRLLVEVVHVGGASALVTLPAVHGSPYTVGDRVLVLFQGADAASGVVAGRIDVLADAGLPDGFVRADGSVPLTAAWDTGAAGIVLAPEIRARDASGLRLADAGGLLGLHISAGGSVGVGTTVPQGLLQLWDGMAGHLFASYTGVTATPQVIVAAGTYGVTEMARLDTMVSNGTGRAQLAFALQHGGVMTQNLVTGSDIWQFRLNGNGSIDLRRTTGTGTAVAVVRVMWM